MAFCSIDDVLEFLPGLSRNSSNDCSDAAITVLIDTRYSQIVSIANYLGYTLPLTESIPLSNRDLILKLLNVEFPVSEIVYRRTGEIQPGQYRNVAVHRNIAKKNFMLFQNGVFDFAFTNTLPITPVFCTAEEVADFLPGFSIETDPDLPPSRTIIEKWISMESALIYNYIKYLNYDLDISSITTSQLNIYKKIVVTRVAFHLVRARALINTVALNQAVINLNESYEMLHGDFLNRTHDLLLL